MSLQSAPRDVAEAAPDSPGQGRVLVLPAAAEDVELLRLMLGDAEFLWAAASEEEARGRIAEGNIALALVSADLPHGRGFQIAEWIRHENGLEAVPVMIYGREEREDTRALAYSSGAVDFLPWPAGAPLVRLKVNAFRELHRRHGQEKEHALAAVLAQRAALASQRTTLSTTVQEEQERFLSMIHSVSDAVITTDSAGRVTFLNAPAQQLTGWSDENALGQSVEEVFRIAHGRTGQSAASPVVQSLAEGVAVAAPGETKLITNDGREYWVESRALPMRRGAGNDAGAVLVFRDVSASKRLQEERAELTAVTSLTARINRVLTEEAKLRTVLQHCTDTLVRELSVASARLWLHEEGDDVLVLEASSGLDTDLQGGHAQVQSGTGRLGLVALMRQPQITNTLRSNPDPGEQAWVAEHGLTAFAGFPLMIEQRFLGVLAIFTRNPLSLAILEALKSISDAIASGIDRNQRGEELRRQREWLQVTLAGIGDAVVMTDTDGIVTFLNPAAEEMIGWRQREAFDQAVTNILHLAHEGTRERIEDPITAVLREGKRRDLSTALLFSRTGTELPIEVSAAPIKDSFGVLTGAVMIFHNVTERRGSERALRQSEERFRMLSEIVPQFVWTMLPGGELDYVNVRWSDYTGQSLEQAQGTGWIEAVHPDDQPHARSAWQQAAATGESYEMEYRLRDREGNHRWYLARGLPMRDANGAIIRWFGTFTDIHHNKMVEAALHKARSDAEMASQAKDQFLAALSHELRTPLTPVMMSVEILLEDPALPPKVRRDLEMIRRNVDLEARLIDDLLDLTRISRGKLELALQAAEPAKVLEHALETCRPDIAAKHLALELDLATNLPVAQIDPSRLTQVYWNVLKNAVKFTPPEGRVAIHSRYEPGPVPAFIVEVSDSGIGIEPSAQETIFDAFEQGDRSITRLFGGLGLGLAISKAIIDLHGGSIRARSAGKDLGATFSITLPLKQPKSSASENRPDPPPPAAEAGEARPPRKVRILLVEDHLDTATVLCRMLERSGHQVTLAHNVADALAAASAAHEEGGSSLDLVVSDLGLPDGSGLDMMRTLSAKFRLRGLALSGYGMEHDLEESAKAGFARHLTKPVNFDEVRAAITELAG